LIKFATRIPIFMYLTDFREACLKDVITQLEPGLFKRVTGLTVKDFELLVSLGLFNDSEMNSAVYYFRRYEDASLEYAGINKHDIDSGVGLFSTTISRDEFDEMEKEQLASMRGTALVRSVSEDESKQIAPEPRKETRMNSKIGSKVIPTKPTPTRIENSTGYQLKDDNRYTQKVAETHGHISLRNGIKGTPVKRSAPAVSVGMKAVHKKFGSGTITMVTEDKVELTFDKGGKKTFVYPMSFENGFITLTD